MRQMPLRARANLNKLFCYQSSDRSGIVRQGIPRFINYPGRRPGPTVTCS